MKKGDEKMTDMILDFNDMKNQYICGDCLSVLSSVPDNSIDLIMTSPPYADQIKDYGNVVKKIKPSEYIDSLNPLSGKLILMLFASHMQIIA